MLGGSDVALWLWLFAISTESQTCGEESFGKKKNITMLVLLKMIIGRN